MMEDFRIRAKKSDRTFDYDITFYEKQNTDYYVIQFSEASKTLHQEGELIPHTIKLSYEQAEDLMDQLWREGCRPKTGGTNALYH